MEYYNQYLIKESHKIYKKYNNNVSKTLFFKENINELLYQCDTFLNSLLHIFIECDDIDGFEAMYCFLKDLIKTSNSKNINFVKKIINLQNINGDTAVHIAARKSKGEDNKFTMIIELLENLGADLSIANKKNEVIKKISENNYNKEIQDMKNKIKNCLFLSNDIGITDFEDDNDDTSPVMYVSTFENTYNIPHSNSNFLSPEYLDAITTTDVKKCSKKNKSKNYFEDQSKLNNNTDINTLMVKLQDDIKQRNIKLLNGGKQNSESSSDSEYRGNRILHNPYIDIEGGTKVNEFIDIEGGSKKANEIHNQIIEKIQKQGYSLEDAKDIKNFIYYEIKDKYPTLNNEERAIKMLEFVDKKLKNIKIEEIRKELEKYRERRDANMEKKPKEKKPKEKKEKKTSKRLSKKTSKKLSKKK